jgi:predicted Zn-dependent protease
LRWLGSHPEDSRVRKVLAQFYTASSQPREARPELEALSRQLPDDAAVLNNLAWTYLELGDKRAEDVARRAHELAPSNPVIADTYGWILLRQQHTRRAFPLLEQAARAAAGNAEIQYHYGVALAAVGKSAEARAVLERLMGLKQDFAQRPDAEKLLAQLRG